MPTEIELLIEFVNSQDSIFDKKYEALLLRCKKDSEFGKTLKKELSEKLTAEEAVLAVERLKETKTDSLSKAVSKSAILNIFLYIIREKEDEQSGQEKQKEKEDETNYKSVTGKRIAELESDNVALKKSVSELEKKVEDLEGTLKKILPYVNILLPKEATEVSDSYIKKLTL